jgi:hypothetical protein
MVPTIPSASFITSLESALSCSAGTIRRRHPPSSVTPTRPTNKIRLIILRIVVAFQIRTLVPRLSNSGS